MAIKIDKQIVDYDVESLAKPDATDGGTSSGGDASATGAGDSPAGVTKNLDCVLNT